MDIKKIGTTTGIFAGSFLVILVITYLLYPVIHPEEAEQVELQLIEKADTQEQENENVKTETAAEPQTNELSGEIPITESRIAKPDVNEFDQLEKDYLNQIDSLKSVITELQVQHKKKLDEVRKAVSDEETQETTKTLLNLDEEALAPIVNQLEEPILVRLYKNASSMQKQKLLQALEPEKASNVLKIVML
ncbi:MAG: hypothetical protein ACFCU6_08865 [Balneolaceae bacterium]